jgi:hypothetical protein
MGEEEVETFRLNQLNRVALGNSLKKPVFTLQGIDVVDMKYSPNERFVGYITSLNKKIVIFDTSVLDASGETSQGDCAIIGNLA